MNINDPVTKLPFVGERYSKLLSKLDVQTIEDLLYHIPFRYEDYSNIKAVSDLMIGEVATVYGQIISIKNIYTKNRKRLTKAVLQDSTGKISIVWFNQFFLTRTIKSGVYLSISGKVSVFDGELSFVSPQYEIVHEKLIKKNLVHTGRLIPIYPETKGISSKWIRSKINFILKNIQGQDLEFLPTNCLKENDLINIEKALQYIHFPKDASQIKRARKRLAFEELFLLHAKALARRNSWKKRKVAKKVEFSDNHSSVISNFINNLPFNLTNTQKKAVDEIIDDITSEKPMNRLLQGDVGSGKTIVSIIILLLVHLNKGKSLYVAPTEILANQHFKTLNKFLSSYNIKLGLLTGSRKIFSKDCNIIVGTHAILYNKLPLEDIAFVVIDEQHRFGVEQRAALLKKTKKSKTPHLLTMTATPIPRSLALTIYGDLNLSIIDEMPKGRQIVTTWVVPNHKRTAAYNWIRTKITKEKEQAFVICPLIEESEFESLKSVKAAKDEYERLKDIFKDLNLGLLHGKIKAKEKEKIMEEFKEGKIDILVSTPVVEVGVDVPNATIMVIEGADRFGLASLHQLRGRVGRSSKKSYCLLFTESKSTKSWSRLKYMEKYHNGLKLAQTDLKYRGPGEIYGTKQHGILNLKVANIFDTKLVTETRGSAQKYIREINKYPKLKRKLEYVIQKDVEPN